MEDSHQMDEDDEYFTHPGLEYEPTNFIKCHSRVKGDRNDRTTKVNVNLYGVCLGN